MISLIALLDDVATLLDDTATMAKVAAKKTAGILGDDLAVNAEQSARFRADRELHALWAITKGSFLNKLILLPLVLMLAWLIPWAIPLALLAGAAYLAYEGAENVLHFVHPHSEKRPALTEEQKIRGAIRTDFVLSLEIIVIALASVQEASFPVQVVAVTIVALLATVGVYGLVALIVRLDDLGYWLIRRGFPVLGAFFVRLLYWIIRLLAVIGTLAMLLVAGGILLHEGTHLLHLAMPDLNVWREMLYSLLLGLILGFVLVGGQAVWQRLRQRT